MKIAITATGPDLEAKVDPRFGRCPYFLIVQTDDLSFEAVENPNVTLGGGAGIQSGQLMSEKGVTHVLTGNCGPNAYQTLSATGIGVIVGCSGPIRDIIEQYKAGQLVPVSQPSVAGHFGTGVSGGAAGPADSPNPPFTPAMGPGGGRGMGMGRGMGRGMGMGQGGGRGMGGGMGRGRGMGFGGGLAGAQSPPPAAAGPDDELSALKQQAELLSQQMQQIQHRLAELEQEKRNG